MSERSTTQLSISYRGDHVLLADSRANIAKIGLASDLNRSEHPLKGLSMADTGRRDAPLADDIYDIPPGIVSRERHGLYA